MVGRLEQTQNGDITRALTEFSARFDEVWRTVTTAAIVKLLLL